MGESRAERLLRSVEGLVYWAAAAPAAACLPAALGYDIARRRGDWEYGVPARETRRDGAQPAAVAR